MGGTFIDKYELQNLQVIKQRYEMQLKIIEELKFKNKNLTTQLDSERTLVNQLNQKIDELRNNKSELKKFNIKFEAKKNEMFNQQSVNDKSNVNSILKWEDLND